MNKLLALADRVEKLTGPDREVDAEVALACGIVRERDGNCFYGHKDYSSLVLERDYYDIEGSAPELPTYTASLDAAMTLVPKNHMWSVESTGYYARVECYPGAGESAALALTCAALRARAHGGGEG